MSDSTSISLQGVSTTTLQTWLSQAQNAMQQLMVGASVTSVSYAQGQGQRMVVYRKTDLAQLRAWIQELQLAINPASACQFRRAPLRPRF